MPRQPQIQTPQPTSFSSPIKPGSELHRALQLIATEIAKSLDADGTAANQQIGSACPASGDIVVRPSDTTE